jgi:hypothetical protein
MSIKNIIFGVVILAMLFWLIRSNKKKSPRNELGTQEILYKDSTFILTTKLDTVYYDPEKAADASEEEARDIRSAQDH